MHSTDPPRSSSPTTGWFEPVYALPLVFACVILAALLLSWRININLFSLHHFYRNRLTRCYLGATNDDRRPHPLTGFDAEDDVRLSALRGQKPLHIVGAAINLNRGKQLAWQNRRAASFAFTALHTGYAPASRQVSGGYRDTAMYGRDADGTSIQLGSVMAISGAAASPNQPIPGTLVYWKSSLTENTPPDIMHYQRSHNDFPHESTADQFFDESQFESYRHLGYEVAKQSIEAMRNRGELPKALQ
ncbi:MAG: hypothetical protein ACKVQT_00230 [Burkholderiales bacterium]